MTTGAPRGRTDRRGILRVKSRGRAFKMKIGAALQQSDAAVPAKNAVVVAGGTNFLRFGEAAHGFFDQWQKDVRRVADNELRLGAAFVQKATIIVLLVGVTQTLKNG